MSISAALVIAVAGLFVPIGPEYHATAGTSSPAASTTAVDVAIADDGQSVVVYASDAQASQNVVNMFVETASGSRFGFGGVFGTATAGVVFSNPSVAVAADGRIVIVAERLDTNVGVQDIVARTFNAQGQPEQPVFTVNSPTPMRKRKEPSVAMFANGDFHVVWTEEFSPTDDDVYHAIWFNSTTNPFAPFLVPTALAASSGDENLPRVSVDPGQVQLGMDEPSMVVFFRKLTQDFGTMGYFAQRVHTSGALLGDSVPFTPQGQVSDMDAGDVAMTEDGGYVAVVELDGEIFRRRFDSTGVVQGTGAMDAGPGLPAFHSTVRVAAGKDGDYVVAFQYTDETLFSEYNADDSTRNPSSRAEFLTGLSPIKPAIDVSRNGLYAVIGWQTGKFDSSFVFMRRFQRIGNSLDSDGDGVSDSFELANGSNSSNPASLPLILDLNFDGQVNEADAIFWYRNLIGANPRTIPAEPAP